MRKIRRAGWFLNSGPDNVSGEGETKGVEGRTEGVRKVVSVVLRKTVRVPETLTRGIESFARDRGVMGVNDQVGGFGLDSLETLTIGEVGVGKDKVVREVPTKK